MDKSKVSKIKIKKKIRPSSSLSPSHTNINVGKGKDKFNMTGINFAMNNSSNDLKERSLSKDSIKNLIPMKQIKFPLKKA